MNRPIFTGLAPNLEKDDIRLALMQFARPWTWHTTEPVTQLEHAFHAYLKQPYTYAFASGRTCLYAILSQLGVTTGDEVLLQAYTCVAVPNPVLWTGATPIYVDCDKATLTMSIADLETKITTQSKVLIIQHTLGQPADLDGLLAIAKKHHLFVIEDCAHALGATYHGQLVGTFGDAAFFSFGRDKIISSVFGGILTVKDTELALRIAAYQRSLSRPSSCWILQQLCHPILTGTAKATYASGLGKIILAVCKRLRLIASPVEPQEYEGRAPSFAFQQLATPLAILARHQLQKLPRFQSHRTELVRRYMTALKETPLTLPVPLTDTVPAWLRYTIRTPNAADLLRQAKQEQIYLGDWYRTAIAPLQVNHKAIAYTSCPHAEEVACETLNLPTDINTSFEDADRVIDFLQRHL